MVPATDPQRPEATRLGSYEILRKLARGGMAELFLARTNGPEGFEKLVVLKKILPNFAENPKFVRLFLDEARLAATLDHPHIAHVYDMGKVDGHYFFTMEYIHGQDVRATLRRTARLDQKLPIDHAVQIVHATASALHYAHERRKPDGSLLDIVHRDVSPSNILISYDGAIKLVDFGVAKAATSSVKTRTGTLKGKIGYMSPEQAKGGTVDRRSDVFSLGIVLWETVTTQRLFKGDNDLATIQLIINSRPQPPRELRPEISPELERIILKALDTDPETRYQTAEELQLDLEELTREEKLKQSSVALRAHMQDLFADEIRAWRSAQESGVTLTDHVVSASVVEMTTPVSENELSFLDDDDDDGSRLMATEGMITETTPRQQAAQAATIELQISKVVVASSPNIVVGRVDQTPPPPPAAPVAPMVMSASGRMPAFSPIGHQPSGPIRIPQDSGLMMIASTSFVREPTAFPIAPREWRAEAKQAIGQDASEPKRRRLIIASLIGVAVLAMIALATGGTEPPVSAAAEIKPEPVETGPVNMQVEPPATPNAGSATTTTNAGSATAPAAGSATAPAAGSATAPAAGSATAPPATTTGSATETPATTTAPTTPPATTTTTRPATNPHPTITTTTRPTTTPHHTATTTVPKTDPKTHPKDVNPPTHRYDPNSALPPP